MFAFTSLVAGAMTLTADAEASEHTLFSASVPQACEYTGPNAPVLRAEVCWDGDTLSLSGDDGCPSGTRPYYQDYGEVIDPLTLEVAAYIPLPDACVAGYCTPMPVEPPPGIYSDTICCGEGSCTLPDAKTKACPVGDMVYCMNVHKEADGTVTCLDED